MNRKDKTKTVLLILKKENTGNLYFLSFSNVIYSIFFFYVNVNEKDNQIIQLYLLLITAVLFQSLLRMHAFYYHVLMANNPHSAFLYAERRFYSKCNLYPAYSNIIMDYRRFIFWAISMSTSNTFTISSPKYQTIYRLYC